MSCTNPTFQNNLQMYPVCLDTYVWIWRICKGVSNWKTNWV